MGMNFISEFQGISETKVTKFIKEPTNKRRGLSKNLREWKKFDISRFTLYF